MSLCDRHIRRACYREQTVEQLCFSLEGLEVSYRLFRLWVAEAQYYVEVRVGSEQCCAYLGRDALRARRAFCRLAEGGVLPCTLRDIADGLDRL